MSILCWIVNTVIFLLAYKYFCKLFLFKKCLSTRKLHGKTVIVTGGNRGIGYETAEDLARRGARVIITSENKEDCIKAREKIIKETGNKNVVAKYLDFTSLEVTRAFAKDILDTEDRLDVLINNAGVFGVENKFTKDGIVLGLQINYFGHFLLTLLLIDLLKKSKPSRIINITSVLSQFYKKKININALPKPFAFDLETYNKSKMFMVYMTWELAARLKDSGVTVNCVHPGVVGTDILDFRNWSRLSTMFRIFYLFMFTSMFVRRKTPKEGAQTSIHVAVSEEVEGMTGIYFKECRPYKPYIKKDLNAISTLWNKSIELVKLSPEEIKI